MLPDVFENPEPASRPKLICDIAPSTLRIAIGMSQLKISVGLAATLGSRNDVVIGRLQSAMTALRISEVTDQSADSASAVSTALCQ